MNRSLGNVVFLALLVVATIVLYIALGIIGNPLISSLGLNYDLSVVVGRILMPAVLSTIISTVIAGRRFKGQKKLLIAYAILLLVVLTFPLWWIYAACYLGNSCPWSPFFLGPRLYTKSMARSKKRNGNTVATQHDLSLLAGEMVRRFDTVEERLGSLERGQAAILNVVTSIDQQLRELKTLPDRVRRLER